MIRNIGKSMGYITNDRLLIAQQTPQEVSLIMIISESDNETVNHRVGGSSPSQGAIISGITGILEKCFCAIESALCQSSRVIAIFLILLLSDDRGPEWFVSWCPDHRLCECASDGCTVFTVEYWQ